MPFCWFTSRDGYAVQKPQRGGRKRDRGKAKTARAARRRNR